MAWAALTGPMPGRSSQSGDEVVDDGLQLGAVGLECAGGVAQGEGEAADLGVPHGLLAAGVAGRAAPGQASQAGVGERGAGEFAVGVVAAQQQRAEPVGLRGAGGGEFVTGTEQDPQRFAVAVRAWGGQPVGVQAQRGQHGQVGVDRVGLAACPRRALRWGCSHSSTTSPAAAAARASPMP